MSTSTNVKTVDDANDPALLGIQPLSSPTSPDNQDHVIRRNSDGEDNDSRRRWSKPAKALSPKIGITVTGFLEELDELEAEVDDDDLAWETQADLEVALEKLQSNFHTVQNEREAMEKYCAQIEESVASKAELVNLLNADNLKLQKKIATLEQRMLKGQKKKLPPPPSSGTTSNRQGQRAHSRTQPKPPSSQPTTIAEPSNLSKPPFKGMTIPEQAEMFDERVHNTIVIDDLKQELITIKGELAKSEWSREHERLYFLKRSRLIKKILSQPLTEANQLRVAKILHATEEHYSTPTATSSLEMDDVPSSSSFVKHQR
eukprot:m.147594 g.147594  ORF g.147594 m.147594 type:complete len:316 (+) comp30547_c1_seq1:1275-2222(+)